MSALKLPQLNRRADQRAEVVPQTEMKRSRTGYGFLIAAELRAQAHPGANEACFVHDHHGSGTDNGRADSHGCGLLHLHDPAARPSRVCVGTPANAELLCVANGCLVKTWK